VSVIGAGTALLNPVHWRVSNLIPPEKKEQERQIMSLPISPPTEPVPCCLALGSQHSAAAFGYGIAVPMTQESTPTTAPTAQPGMSVAMQQQCGQDIGCWPAYLLEKMLSHLSLADLGRAAGTCPHWYQIARQRSLQLRCLANAYPAHFRHYLEQTLDADLLRERLAIHEQRPPAQEHREEPAGMAGQFLSREALFHALTLCMLQTNRIHVDDSVPTIPCCCLVSSDNDEPGYSPDGRHFMIRDSPQALGTETMSVWRQDNAGLHRTIVHLSDDRRLFNGARFSLDSRQLLAVNPAGRLQIWLLQTDDGWLPAPDVELCHTKVDMAVFSPDAHWLALKTGAWLLLYGETAPSVWHECCSLRWASNQDPDTILSFLPRTMQFSGDSRHFVFVGIGSRTRAETAWIFDRHGAHWQTQRITRGPASCYWKGLLSPHGTWLAIAAAPNDSAAEYVAPGTGLPLELWRHHDESGSWRFVSEYDKRSAWLCFSMAFSPDGQQLALNDRLDHNTVCVSVLSLTPQGNWTCACQLLPGPGLVHPLQRQNTFSIHFSSNGHYLAATAVDSVQLWQYQAGSWNPAAWIEDVDPHELSPLFCPLLCVFSPDGYHCAVARGLYGKVSIHGPGPDGRFLTKVEWKQGCKIKAMRFSPEGTRLLLACDGPHGLESYARVLRLDPLAKTATTD